MPARPLALLQDAPYPILRKWGASENNRRAKYYSLTRSGQKQLAAEMDQWRRLMDAVSLVLEMG